MLTFARRFAITQIWPAGAIPRTVFAVAVVTGGVAALTATLEIGFTPMPPLNLTIEGDCRTCPKVAQGTRTTNKSPRPDIYFMTHSSEGLPVATPPEVPILGLWVADHTLLAFSTQLS